MMISDAMNIKLNGQVAAEFSAAHTYLAMACALDRMGLKILAARFLAQYEEERGHALKILHYVEEVGGNVTLEGVSKPAAEYTSVEAIVRTALESERDITRMIGDLVALADSEKDYATRSFLNWFVDEQVEEVSSMNDLLTLVQLAGDNMLQVEARVRHEMTSKS